MHYHLEIIMPPTSDVNAAVEWIMTPFDEQGEDEDGDPNRHGFWDFYVIGGRWSGVKLAAKFAPDRLAAFRARLAEEKVTVSGMRPGKQELHPADQIPKVDALWRESFPESPVTTCPLFWHFNDQYSHSDGFPDVMRLADVPASLTAGRVIVAGPSWKDDSTLEASYMVQESVWNGVTHVESAWDGRVQSAIDDAMKRLAGCTREYLARNTPSPDWLAVTVDYHS